MSSIDLRNTLSSIATQLPLILIAIAGIVVASINWKKASSASVWTLIACVLLLVSTLIMPLLQTIIWQTMARSGSANYQAISIGTGLLWSTVRGASFVMLIVAVYLGRKPPMEVPPSLHRT